MLSRDSVTFKLLLHLMHIVQARSVLCPRFSDTYILSTLTEEVFVPKLLLSG